eukprot:CAMPEP_0171200054 /NCGR_PEP_ID=MMETSP0790-20130122/23783_1 /TAXON_ID=2925 /ORGANISM="Alexandrium catenella, Strain OF101" /LENGTH=73 /DNA_ID=CAMNT_0011665423 /DNA_START=36 /DNA_END=255 /DNA_ORIENTATION=+
MSLPLVRQVDWTPRGGNEDQMVSRAVESAMRGLGSSPSSGAWTAGSTRTTGGVPDLCDPGGGVGPCTAEGGEW